MWLDLTLWPSRPVLVNDAVEAAKSICSAASSSMCFALLPQLHSSTDANSVLAKRGQVEDLMMAHIGCTY